jgi:hypothetical protein
MKAAKIFGIIALMPVIYILSAGPVLRFYVYTPTPSLGTIERGNLQRQRWVTFTNLYAPLYWMSNNSPWVESAFYWYRRVWLGSDS